MADYVFGYGSLISTESRLRSGESDISAPVRVNGLRREWNLPVPTYGNSRGITGLGVLASDLDGCNGVLFRCKDLKHFKDREEKHGYKTQVLPKDKLIFLNQGLDLSKQDGLWYFSPLVVGIPSKIAPIRQSYLDVCLAGCLEQSERFAREFVKTTFNWFDWVNDRNNPCYEHPISWINTSLIDDILSEELGKDFKRTDE